MQPASASPWLITAGARPSAEPARQGQATWGVYASRLKSHASAPSAPPWTTTSWRPLSSHSWKEPIEAVEQGVFVGVGRVLINRVRLHSPTDVRFAPTSGEKADVPGGPSRANSGRRGLELQQARCSQHRKRTTSGPSRRPKECRRLVRPTPIQATDPHVVRVHPPRYLRPVHCVPLRWRDFVVRLRHSRAAQGVGQPA